ncbi:hypothetical protein FUAX_53320 (plasmid) [Fulvitalea axinellae]|uniref:histidine kinase n=1 Tax=Fulvitalea axinellae TaxID=1182444 RepID=A0AAU9DK47_9BACT|nr:hypothetical protein FUAX_53320 [Fulvitalea axinellae]
MTKIHFRKLAENRITIAENKARQQKNLLEAVVRTQEDERERIAAELHDNLIGKLTAIKLYAELRPENPVPENLIDQSIDIARGISHDLCPPMLEYTSIEELVERQISPWKARMSVLLRSDIRTEGDRISNDFKVQIIRIIQELATNAGKHADASEIDVRLRHTGSGTVLIFKDNGKGYDMLAEKKGIGLRNIETRVQCLEGKYKIKSKKGVGTANIFLFRKNRMIDEQ